MKSLHIAAGIVAISLLAGSSYGASIVVNMDSGDKEFRDFTGLLVLTPGGKSGSNQTADHDGAVIQLGYFSNTLTSDLFDGTWIPLSGEGSAAFNSPNANFKTTIGDTIASGASDGQFGIQLLFTDANSSTILNLPPPGTPLAIRVYNSTTIGTSTHFETVSSTIPGWLWRSPADPQPVSIDLSLADNGLRLQSTNSAPAANGRIQTSILTIPEPSSLLLISTGGFVLFRRRERK